MDSISRLFVIISLTVMSVSACNCPGPYTVNVSGEGADFCPDSSRVLIFDEEHSDIRFDKPLAYGYIKDGNFRLSFRDSTARVCRMVFEDDVYDDYCFMTFDFFSDRKPVHFRFSRRFDNYIADISGSSDNEELYMYRNKSIETHKTTDSISYELTKWTTERYGENGWPEEGSDEHIFLTAAYDSINAMYVREEKESGYDKWKLERMRSNKSMAGLYEITQAILADVSRVKYSGEDGPDSVMLRLYAEYREIFPDNPMVRRTDSALSALKKIRPGMQYQDFEAPSTDGNRYTLSELIEGKIAVLDCWASWCGPCRRHSIELIPLYEKYKDKGFTVIGVAREYGNLNAMKHAVETDGYPWIQLYDLDEAEGIWKLYGISGGGSIFLIGKDGKIVEEVTDIKSVRQYLKEHLD